LHQSPAKPLRASPSPVLTGSIMVPGDKSISHRALMLGAIAIGETVISGLLESEDVIHTAKAMGELGADIQKSQGRWRVQGVGVGGFAEPARALDFGNSGTGARLAMGLIASSPFTADFTGDASLSRRPMGRVMAPLEKIGARFEAAEGGRLPLKIHGARDGVPITYRLPVASAQVKSAVLLAGLNVAGRTSVIEPVATRDHTERMLKAFGAKISVEQQGEARQISLSGQEELSGQAIVVPADPSSAAFAIVAGLITRSSKITIENVMLNPTRSGLIETLIEMGAQLTISNRREAGGELVGDVTVVSSRLRGVRVPAQRAASMIDEYPILAVAAAFAEGATRMEGLEELRVKESDRLAAVAEGLSGNGVKVAEGPDWLEVTGGKVAGGAVIRTQLDHRIAMSFLIMGLAAKEPVIIDDATMIATSFPNFRPLFTGLGARIDPPGVSH
jgi:3-phosphoshikimate 1-carboxyvinyltransferase